MYNLSSDLPGRQSVSSEESDFPGFMMRSFITKKIFKFSCEYFRSYNKNHSRNRIENYISKKSDVTSIKAIEEYLIEKYLNSRLLY